VGKKDSPANSSTGLNSAFASAMGSFIARNAKAHVESFGNMAFPNEKGAIVASALRRTWFAVWRGEFSPDSLVINHCEITHLAVMRNSGFVFFEIVFVCCCLSSHSDLSPIRLKLHWQQHVPTKD